MSENKKTICCNAPEYVKIKGETFIRFGGCLHRIVVEKNGISYPLALVPDLDAESGFSPPPPDEPYYIDLRFLN